MNVVQTWLCEYDQLGSFHGRRPFAPQIVRRREKDALQR